MVGAKRVTFGVVLLVATGLVVLPASAAPESRSHTLDASELQAALLTVKDLPRLDDSRFTGWTSTPEEPPSSVGRCDGPNALTRATNAGVMARGSVNFASQPDLGPGVSEQIYVFPSAAKAGTFLAQSKAAAMACTTSRLPQADQSVVTLETSRLPFLAIGDQRFATKDRVSRTYPDPARPTPEPSISDAAYMRENNVVIVVGASGKDVDTSTFEGIAFNALLRLKSAAR
jgi:hypothetical protein